MTAPSSRFLATVTAPPGSAEYYRQMRSAAGKASRAAAFRQEMISPRSVLGKLPRNVALRIRVGEPDACWEWQGTRDRNGYGGVRVNGRRCLAHRVVLAAAIGELPPGAHVCHRCDNPPCCNPAHLFAGSPRDNIRDSMAKGRHGSQKQAGKKRGPYRKRTA